MLYAIWGLRIRVDILEHEKQERVELLTDPNVIDYELERSARRREAFDSHMPYPPRDDSGPAAKIWTARLGRIKNTPKKDG